MMGAYSLAQAGDTDALAALVRQHIPLVQALARRFSYCEDAFQQGCMGLVSAIRGFREEMGRQFSSYAVPWILGEMRRGLSHTLGWRARAALKRAIEYQRCQQQMGREPTISQMADAAGIPREELILLMERAQSAVPDETGTLLASVPDPRGEGWLLRLCIRDILNRMPWEESWLLFQRFIRGATQQQLAHRLHTTQSRISRKEKQARLRFQRAWTEE